jgi:hypothetical protein
MSYPTCGKSQTTGAPAGFRCQLLRSHRGRCVNRMGDEFIPVRRVEEVPPRYPRFQIIWDHKYTNPAVLDCGTGLVLARPLLEAARIADELNATPRKRFDYDWPADGSKGWEDMPTPE